MKTRIAEKEAFRICGYAVETNPENNDQDISRLYEKFEKEGYDGILKQYPGSKIYCCRNTRRNKYS
jgi:predicted transcriptional regulator YdeE